MKNFWLTCCLALLVSAASAQLVLRTLDRDSGLIKRYQNDTTGFITITDTGMTDSLKPSHRFVAWEVNTIHTMIYVRHGYPPGSPYKNLWRYPKSGIKQADSVLLTHCDLLHSFTACLCADLFPWYMSVKTHDAQLLTVNNESLMQQFLGKIDNPYNAVLWLHVIDETLSEPGQDGRRFHYKKVKNGYLIRYNTRVDEDKHSHVTYGDLTVFMGADFRVLFISKKNVVETNYEM